MERPKQREGCGAGEEQDEGYNHNYQDSASRPAHNDLNRVLSSRWILVGTVEVLLQPFTPRLFVLNIRSFDQAKPVITGEIQFRYKEAQVY
jgi:hypothetical protein